MNSTIKKLIAVSLTVENIILAELACPLNTTSSSYSGTRFYAFTGDNDYYTCAQYGHTQVRYLLGKNIGALCNGGDDSFGLELYWGTAMTKANNWDPDTHRSVESYVLDVNSDANADAMGNGFH